MCIFAYIQMDVFGILILLFFWLNQRKSGGSALDDRLFNGILIVTMIEQLMDAGQWLLDGMNFTGVYGLQMFCYTVGYGVAPMITCLWVMYCDLRVHMDEDGLKRRVPLYLLPIAFNTVLLIINLFTPLVFRIDSAHIYHRDGFFWVYMAVMYLYGVISMLIVMRKALHAESATERTEYRYMALFIIPPVIGGILQGLFYGISLIWLCTVLSLILVYTKVLSYQILTDPLTGLNNRRKLNQYLGMKINSTEERQTLFLIMMDADGFKSINDDYGHAAGDRALVAISNILKGLCSKKDCFLARLGGDEFLMIGNDLDAARPEIIAKQIEERIGQFNAASQEPFRLSLSIGWSRFRPREVDTVDALLNAADRSMYTAKRNKKSSRPKPAGGETHNGRKSIGTRLSNHKPGGHGTGK